MSMGADINSKHLGAGGALQLLKHAVLLDAAGDDDCGGDAEILTREVDLLGRRCALELVELKHVTVNTAKGKGMRTECQWAH